MDMVLQFVGRLHPLVIHFPIALIVVATLFELGRGVWPGRPWSRAIPAILLVAAATSLLAVGTGWLFAEDFAPPPSQKRDLYWHRVLGVAMTVVTLLAAWVASRSMERETGGIAWIRRGLILLAAGLVVVTSHLGALMVWGADYFAGE
ncbi:MAG: DUF2231 domain-containing protein [Kiritimatiellae bacterium]|nr:DUF2231 domain-containing protein [Kiritimatiellia bacterium]